jgi:glycine/D-amino acid oxidase-like deaminating enzyme
VSAPVADPLSEPPIIVLGGGFYGCCLALFLRSIAKQVILLEARDDLLTRASFVNQARVHTGYHYPRSFVTARRSLALFQRFTADFPLAVFKDFRCLYAIARQGSKVTPRRFETMFTDLGAPIERASEMEHALFNQQLVSAVYRCQEYAFDSAKLKETLRERLSRAEVHIRLGAEVQSVNTEGPDDLIHVRLKDGALLSGRVVVDATYGQLCSRSQAVIPPPTELKYELTEVALIEPPPELSDYGITLMDGPFFSTMPFPPRACHSLTHVRYTPHYSWTSSRLPPRETPSGSHWLHMKRDAARYVPCLNNLRWIESLYETKTVLLRNEQDDGRPILLHRSPNNPGLLSVLGGKLDNIYDLFDALSSLDGPTAGAHDGYFRSNGLVP